MGHSVLHCNLNASSSPGRRCLAKYDVILKVAFGREPDQLSYFAVYQLNV